MVPVASGASADNLSDVELLVQEGIDAAWDGEHARARDLLSLAVTLDEANVRGWLWLSSEVEGLAAKEYCLGRVLALAPDHDVAQRELARVQTQAWLRAQAGPGEAEGEQGGLQAALPTVAVPPAAELEPVTAGRPASAPPAAGALAAGAGVPGATERAAGRRAARASRAGPLIRNEFALFAVLGLVLLALIALGVAGLPGPLAPLLSPLRVALGLVFVLFVPGYALQAALFPRATDFSAAERLALSLGLSVALLPPLALILDWLPWGVRLWPLVAAEGLLIVCLSVLALIRRCRLPAEARPARAGGVDVGGWWVGQDRTARILHGVLAGALLLATFSAASVVVLSKPAELLTGFYLLGPEGLAQNHPRQAAPGEPLAVTAGVANREGRAAEYRIEVQVMGETIGGAGPFSLQDGEVWEAPVGYALPGAGEDQQVDFLLYRDGGAEPYRRLRLWIDVAEGGRP